MEIKPFFEKIKYDAITATMNLDELNDLYAKLESKDLYTKLGLQRSKETNNMELSEVFAELENGSAKTYEAYLGSGTRITLSRDGEGLNFQKFDHEGTPYDELSLSGRFSGNCRLGLDWRPVKRSVVWDEAIREWLLGKKIYCEIGVGRIEPDCPDDALRNEKGQNACWIVEVEELKEETEQYKAVATSEEVNESLCKLCANVRCYYNERNVMTLECTEYIPPKGEQ